MLKSICLGVIGGGQLGSLLCSAAKRLKVKRKRNNDQTA